MMRGPGTCRGLSRLAELDLSHNKLTALGGLAGLPLRFLNVSGARWLRAPTQRTQRL